MIKWIVITQIAGWVIFLFGAIYVAIYTHKKLTEEEVKAVYEEVAERNTFHAYTDNKILLLMLNIAAILIAPIRMNVSLFQAIKIMDRMIAEKSGA